MPEIQECSKDLLRRLFGSQEKYGNKYSEKAQYMKEQHHRFDLGQDTTEISVDEQGESKHSIDQ